LLPPIPPPAWFDLRRDQAHPTNLDLLAQERFEGHRNFQPLQRHPVVFQTVRRAGGLGQSRTRADHLPVGDHHRQAGPHAHRGLAQGNLRAGSRGQALLRQVTQPFGRNHQRQYDGKHDTESQQYRAEDQPPA